MKQNSIVVRFVSGEMSNRDMWPKSVPRIVNQDIVAPTLNCGREMALIRPSERVARIASVRQTTRVADLQNRLEVKQVWGISSQFIIWANEIVKIPKTSPRDRGVRGERFHQVPRL